MKNLGLLFAAILLFCGTNSFAQSPFFPAGSSWSYLDDGTDQGTAWREVGFVQTWPTGPTPIGFGGNGNGDATTIIKNNCTYLLKTVTVGSAAGLSNLMMNIVHDDGAIVYINGVEAIRSALIPSGEPDCVTDLLGFKDPEAEVVSYPVSDSFFVDGDNLIAVLLRNQREGSSDIQFDMEFTGDPAAQWVSFQVAASSDDAEEHLDTNNGDAIGDVDIPSSDLELCFESGTGDQLVGIRFTGLTIAPGAKIDSAYIQFTVDSDNDGATSVTIRAEDADSSATFTADAFNISSRSTTTLSQDWQNIPTWATAGDAGPDQQTPDISALVQAVIDRPGYALGNPITLIISGTGEREAESWDGDASAAPRLFIKGVGVTTSVEDEGANVPVTFVLNQNYPNPFNPRTTIQVDIAANHPSNQNISVEIYDLLGRKVRTLFNGTHSPGTLHLSWDATDDLGAAVATGIYIYRLRTGATDVARRMILLR